MPCPAVLPFGVTLIQSWPGLASLGNGSVPMAGTIETACSAAGNERNAGGSGGIAPHSRIPVPRYISSTASA